MMMGKRNGKNAERPHIIRLRAKNIKALKLVELDDLGEIVEIRGDTGQGKTAVLDSIRGAFQGIDRDLIRNGEHSGEVEIDLTGFRVQRIQNEDGSETLMVTDSDGNAIKRQEAKHLLAALCGGSVFDPLSWVRLGGGEQKGRTERLRAQRDQLLQAIRMHIDEDTIADEVEGLGQGHLDVMGEIDLREVEFDQHGLVVCEALHRAVYDFRKYQNQRVKDAEAELSVYHAPEKAPPDKSADEIQAELKAVRNDLAKAEAAMTGRKNLVERRDNLKASIKGIDDSGATDIDERLKESESSIEENDKHIARLTDALRNARERCDQLAIQRRELKNEKDLIQRKAMMEQDLADINESLKDAEDIHVEDQQKAVERLETALERRRQQDQHDVAAEKANNAREISKILDDLVALFRDQIPQRLIEQAELPIDGLGVRDGIITISDIPLHQLGTSEQISVGVRIASALNPRSGFVLVDGAESMGKKDRLALAKAARDLGLQIIMTIVDPDAKPGKGQVVIREGAVA